MSDNGPVIFSSSPYSLKVKLQLPDVSMTLPFGTTRGEAIAFMDNFKAEVSTVISNQPFVHCTTPLQDSDGTVIDEFGMFVYAYSFYDVCSTLKDLRYEPDIP
jgi:hypothetical protein